MAKKKDGDKTSPAGGDKKTTASKAALKEGLELLKVVGGAVLLAVLLKSYAYDIYLIPSGSMETALHGRPDGGDRILCSKFNYRFRSLERWEVAVFEFPYENARRSDRYNISEQYRGQNFVKRVVGMPGESLAIARGDIWVRPIGANTEYQRVVKPHAVQRGMWQNVYDENFSDLRRSELDMSWKVLGGEVGLEKGGPLVLSPERGPIRMDYRPMIPAGIARDTMVELPGIPDRYLLEQPIQFKCRAKLKDGSECGQPFVKTCWTQTVQARCPKCGSLQNELSAVFYHRRSGLASIGRYGVKPDSALQGEESGRMTDYHVVPDLRVAADVSFASEKTRFTVTLSEDNRFVQAIFSADGRVDVQINGQPSRPDQRALAEIRPGKSHRLEFYIVEGVARILVDSQDAPILELPIWKDKRPQVRSIPKESGVGLVVDGGEARLGRIAIDRDIFYYSGWERESGQKFERMNAQGEITVNPETFFPMGDHCPSSYDARDWGPVPYSLLRGPALLIFWPPERAHMIPSPVGSEKQATAR